MERWIVLFLMNLKKQMAYTHKAYVKGTDGKWNVHISGNSFQDSKTYVPSRWTCAKNAACDVIDVWHYGAIPDAMEFYQNDHDRNKFRLKYFSVYVRDADPESYEGEKKWYSNRTSDTE